MNAMVKFSSNGSYERAVNASKAVHWEIDKDVIRGRSFDMSKKYLPDGLSLMQEMDSLSADERRFAGQIQGLLPRCSLLENFTPAELRLLSHFMDVYRAAEGMEVIHEGDGGHVEACRLADQRLRLLRALEKREGRLRVQLDEHGSSVVDAVEIPAVRDTIVHEPAQQPVVQHGIPLVARPAPENLRHFFFHRRPVGGVELLLEIFRVVAEPLQQRGVKLRFDGAE